jgi:hypothetical protein
LRRSTERPEDLNENIADNRAKFASADNAAKIGKEFFPANLWDPVFEKSKSKARSKGMGLDLAISIGSQPGKQTQADGNGGG